MGYPSGFSARLKDFISFKNLSTRGFSNELGYTSPENLYRLFRDEKANPSYEIITDISVTFPDLNIEWLINGRGNMLKNDANNPQINADNGGLTQKKGVISGSKKHNTPLPNEPFASPTASPTRKKDKNPPSYNESSEHITASNYGAKAPAIITVNDLGHENIIYVPIKAQAGYLNGFGDPEFISELPTFRMPGLNHNSYRMFEVSGQSMVPTLRSSDKVIAEWVSNMDELRESRMYVVIHKEGIAVKRLLNRLKERGKLYLKSDTITQKADYPLIEIDAQDIYEIWYVRLKISSDLSEPNEIYNRVADLEINQLQLLKKQAELTDILKTIIPTPPPTPKS